MSATHGPKPGSELMPRPKHKQQESTRGSRCSAYDQGEDTQESTRGGNEGLPFTKGPLVFETTGAMWEEPQKLSKPMVEMDADQRTSGAPQSSQKQGLEHVVSKTVLIVLATKPLHDTCEDAMRTHSG